MHFLFLPCPESVAGIVPWCLLIFVLFIITIVRLILFIPLFFLWLLPPGEKDSQVTSRITLLVSSQDLRVSGFPGASQARRRLKKQKEGGVCVVQNLLSK